MRYSVAISNQFWPSLKKLRPKYTHDEYREIVNEIQESIMILADTGQLPPEYQDHVLLRSPYQNYHEYHLYDDDVLVIYARSDKRLFLRFATVTDHNTLRNHSS